ncbi:MAG: DEAD/DEAH box helicase family protein [Opitutae bacterium]|nr:DEAD/DEAH box helicase family protein [Opitutae bacterium]
MSRNEAQTRYDLIDPVLRDQKGWKHADYMATRLEETARAIDIVDGKPQRRPKGRTDYVLYWDCSGGTNPQPLAVVEAKREGLPPDHGLTQGQKYLVGKLRHVPFVFSTNGHLFVEYNQTSGLTSEPQPLAGFPVPDELCGKQSGFLGFKLDSPAAATLTAPADLSALSLRYYQDAALRAALQKVARDEIAGQPRRVLMPLATGGGKTRLAAAFLKKLDAAGKLTRALFVCDRDPLRTSGLEAMQAAFGNNAAEVSTGNPQPNAKVLVATYQTLGFTPTDDEPATPQPEPDAPIPASVRSFNSPPLPPPDPGDGSFFAEHYPENYFDVIVIDECHRSAWGTWRMILDRNPRAIHLGLTATPRQIKLPKPSDAETSRRIEDDFRLIADNYAYFGEPVYEYDYLQGVEDGYLAPCQILTFDIFHDDQTEPERLRGVARTDVADKELTNVNTGAPVPAEAVEEQTAPAKIDARLVYPERIATFAHHFFNELLRINDGDPHQKTIIFCASDLHARRVAKELNNLYATWCTENNRKRCQKFAFQCMASTDGQELIPDFRGRQQSHFIATTKDLLSTGVDVPCVRNVVFLRYLQSPLLFLQMVGRGTRLDENSGKLMFTLWDYTGATALFGAELITPPPPPPGPPGPPPPPPPPPGAPVQVKGTKFTITDTGQFFVTNLDGKPQRVTPEQYRDLLAERLHALAPGLADFRAQWLDPARRSDLLRSLAVQGLQPEKLPDVSKQADYDLFDLLAALVYGLAPRTRHERAEAFLGRQPAWLVRLPQPTADVIRRIVRQFEAGGTEVFLTKVIRQFSVPEIFKKNSRQIRTWSGFPAT